MRQFLEFLPIVLFFAVYQMDGKTLSFGEWQWTIDGIFSATQVLIAATLLQVVATRLLTGQLEKRVIWTAVAVVAFGSLTLAFRNELFIQWKPTIFNWGLALVFMGSRWFMGKNLLEKALGNQLDLPAAAWNKLSNLWVANFIVVGTLNLVVAYNFSEAFWVSYKLYSSIGFTLFMSVVTMFIISPYLQNESDKPTSLE